MFLIFCFFSEFLTGFSLQSFSYSVNASLTLELPCTIDLTARIIGTGLSDCQMFRPISTPTAPLLIELYANSSALRSGIFLPPAIIIGTGQDSTTFSKFSQ